ncbi:MAG: endopeptidase La [Chloroflexi bacterium]|nr:endopeptidase La [Chloroflexota bacterium]MCH7953390.1 endopeptidase La [Chloroflexota bacterium]MCI0814073.1 endopeptidase La [Chloroflexota bacterium]MCI0816785.1 endopeptidase La [Chloroflexota bacterium]MCI0831148.1 endopeptidase La [Chloroflexota bacterium]
MTDKPKRKKKPAAAPEPRSEELVLPDVMPVIPSGTNVVYPQQLMPVMAVEERDKRAIDEAASSEGKLVAIFSEADEDEGSKGGLRLRDVGTVASIIRMAKAPDGSIHAILQGQARVRLVSVEGEGPPVHARVKALDDEGGADLKAEAVMREASAAFVRAANLSDTMPSEIAAAVGDIGEPAALADFIAANLPLKPDERYQVLAELNVGRRLSLVNSLLKHELEVLEVRSQIQSDVKGELDKRQRDFILREQLKAIQKELGEEAAPELAELRERLQNADLPEVARQEADREIARLEQIPAVSPEYQVVRTYLEWIADLPWNVTTVDQLDIERAAGILDEDHYGLEKVKTRILEFLAVLNLKGGETRGPILCFVGPPGTGKTSLGQSIARALNRNFIHVSLGGMRDEAEIRGHRRTYVGAMPGRIIQEMRRAASANPLMMLDEVDKLGTDFRGDPAAALLEVLDPAQNFTFTDHYLDIAFDLSRVFFIATANLTDTIPPPLLDRMEVIELPGYTEYEKLEIGKRYLLPRQLEENGISKSALRMSEGAIREIIRSYTREAGVRNLERELGSVCRRVARLVVEGEKDQISVTQENVSEFLGPARFRWELAAQKDEVGVATGLAATAAGGDVLFVEATVVPGKGRLTLTGKLGDVMQESAQAALTYARSRADALGIAPAFFDRNDLHIHVPAGAVPKDGPSAGVTMATALVSAMTRRPVRKDVAMTGEITLRGKVLPVGAVRDKILAAHRAGSKRIILPRDNENDLLDVREEVRRDLEFVLVDSVDEVLAAALHEKASDDEPRVEQLVAEN